MKESARLSNNVIPDGNGQHLNSISKRICRRQKKMQESEKNLVTESEGAKSDRIDGLKYKIVG